MIDSLTILKNQTGSRFWDSAECLNHFFVMDERHLDYLVKEYVDHYNSERPHQSKDNKPLIQLPTPAKGEIECKQRLGGLLKHYFREAA